MKRICLISYFTTIFNILFQKIFFNFFSVKTPRSLCLPSLSKKAPSLSIFFLKLAIWQIFGRIQPNFLGKFWLFYAKTNDLQPVSCFVPVLAFVCSMIFLSTNTQLLRATDFAGALSFASGAARAFSHFSFKNCKHSI